MNGKTAIRSIAPKRGTQAAQPLTSNNRRDLEVEMLLAETLKRETGTKAQDTYRKKIIAIGRSLNVPFTLIENQFIAFNGLLCRPDFLIPRFLLVIEIDGGVHSREDKLKADRFIEEQIYFPLGVKVLRFPNEYLYHPDSAIWVNRCLEGIFRDPPPLPECGNLRSKICQHRKRLIESDPIKYRWLENFRIHDIEKNITEERLPGRIFRRWGGTQTTVRPFKKPMAA